MKEASDRAAGGDSVFRRVPVNEAIALVQPGSRVYLGSACAAPRSLLAALEAARPGRP
jgi:hypothetical protein